MIQTAFAQKLVEIKTRIDSVDGWLTDREVSFLALLAAHPTTTGDILEIGSYRGRSTIVLALAKRLSADDAGLIAIDPLPNEHPMARDETGRWSARALFEANLSQSGVRSEVEFHQAYSQDLSQRWDRPLRLLWIDGDHRYASTKRDYDLYSPHLADGAVLAMHDVLSRYDGCIRVFTEDVLSSPHFGAAGVCGSIGWAQYWQDPAAADEYQADKRQLRRRLLPLVHYHCQAEAPRGLSKLRYQVLRACVPHRRVDAKRWAQSVRIATPMGQA